MMKFCAKCGKKGETKEGLCERCYSEIHPSIDTSKEIVIKVCEGCGKALHRNRWSRYVSKGEMIRGITKERLKLDKMATIKASKKGDEAEIETDAGRYIVPVKINDIECPKCKKEATQYFEGTLQLRNVDDRIVEYVMKELDKKRAEGVFVQDIKELKNGIDLKITSQKYLQQIGSKLKKKFGGEVKLTRKLFTRNKQTSRQVYRVTLLYRKD